MPEPLFLGSLVPEGWPEVLLRRDRLFQGFLFRHRPSPAAVAQRRLDRSAVTKHKSDKDWGLWLAVIRRAEREHSHTSRLRDTVLLAQPVLSLTAGLCPAFFFSFHPSSAK